MSERMPCANTVAAGMMPERMRLELRSGAFGILGAAAVLIVGGVALAYQEWRYHRESHFTTAAVVALEPERPSHVVVRYPDRSGAMLEGLLFEEPDRALPAPGSTVAIAVRGQPPMISSDPRPWNWLRPLALLGPAVAIPMAAIGFLRRGLRRQRERYALLQRSAARQPVVSVDTAIVAKGMARWGVIATWRDRFGRTQRTLAAGFDYNPLSLLDPRKLAVLHDGGDPALAIIAPDTLPPCSRSALSRSDRETVHAHAPVSLAYRVTMALAGLASLALLAIGVMRTMRW